MREAFSCPAVDVDSEKATCEITTDGVNTWSVRLGAWSRLAAARMPKNPARWLRPDLYRTIKVRDRPPHRARTHTSLTARLPRVQVVMTDGSTFQVPAAVRMVSKTLQLERDPANHPLYLVRHLHPRTPAVPRQPALFFFFRLCEVCGLIVSRA